jgi:hypothetical protein
MLRHRNDFKPQIRTEQTFKPDATPHPLPTEKEKKMYAGSEFHSPR